MLQIKKRDPVFVILATLFTCGLYHIYWLVVTKDEINSLGAQIPSGWLIIIPIANLYFTYKYAEGFSMYVKKDNNSLMWFLVYFFVAPLAVILFQVELNKIATN